VFWDIKRQNRSSGLTPSRADVQIKKAQTINISPLRGGYAPEPINMPFGVLSRIPDVITHAKFCVNRFPKSAISYTFLNDPYNSSALPCRLWFGTDRKLNNTNSYLWLILAYLISRTVSKLWLIIRQIFATERGVPQFNALSKCDPLPIW